MLRFLHAFTQATLSIVRPTSSVAAVAFASAAHSSRLRQTTFVCCVCRLCGCALDLPHWVDYLCCIFFSSMCVCPSCHLPGFGLCWTLAPLSFLLSLLPPVAVSAFVLRLSARRVSVLQQQHSKAVQEALQKAMRALSARQQLRSLNGEALEMKAFESKVQLKHSTRHAFFEPPGV